MLNYQNFRHRHIGDRRHSYFAERISHRNCTFLLGNGTVLNFYFPPLKFCGFLRNDCVTASELFLIFTTNLLNRTAIFNGIFMNAVHLWVVEHFRTFFDRTNEFQVTVTAMDFQILLKRSLHPILFSPSCAHAIITTWWTISFRNSFTFTIFSSIQVAEFTIECRQFRTFVSTQLHSSISGKFVEL